MSDPHAPRIPAVLSSPSLNRVVGFMHENGRQVTEELRIDGGQGAGFTEPTPLPRLDSNQEPIG